ncbi:HAD-IIA family hydrolase [Fictibacillus phosphorivorans]|uniref:HAD-IIA family hydrolase n=1 Tax=Fictibacillus phosphorivorans TaxID=1221500 RepID=UPI00203B8BE0|nr:HAD-IIA family hydrolase [Fictibacillus phosphorivorans]MCM3720089.1 HAD-IIA family hydrolase [Fictibacillus phosphorivorans]MCM3777779.1 HAD-IIA family hydrolase [Fictibacillus phosphorivorans]
MKEIRGYIFDLDGTIYLGNQLVKEADNVIKNLQKEGKQILFLTNKTIETRQKYVEKLQGFHIKVTIDNILNPTVTLINYLKENHPGAKLYIIGEQIIKDEIGREPFPLAATPEETDIVIISWDRNFHYDHLNFAYQAIKKGALTIATNPDRTCPIENGEVPDCAGMIGAIESVTGKKVDIHIGKPSTLTIKAALNILNLEPDECIMIGDRLETDIRMGIEAGMKTALVLTGVTQANEVPSSEWQPDYVFSSVKSLLYNKVL